MKEDCDRRGSGLGSAVHGVIWVWAWVWVTISRRNCGHGRDMFVLCCVVLRVVSRWELGWVFACCLLTDRVVRVTG